VEVVAAAVEVEVDSAAEAVGAEAAILTPLKCSA
jgi:hypothetical protein